MAVHHGPGALGKVGGDDAGSHPASQATDAATLPDAASAGSTNAAPAASDHNATPQNVPPEASNEGTPRVNEAPSDSNLATALDATGDTPGNTVLNDLINTAPGAERGATIAESAQNFASTQVPTPPVPDTAPVPDQATSHTP